MGGRPWVAITDGRWWNRGGAIAWRAVLANRNGTTSIEYALLATVVAVVIVGAVSTLGDGVLALFDQVVAGF